jgi:hypothetical protein
MTDFDKTLSLEWCFPDASSILSTNYKSLQEIKGSCVVGLDTSVLLAPYNLDSASIAAVEKIYRKLIDEKRLAVPERSIREYAKNRIGKVADLVHALESYGSRTVAPTSKVIEFLGDAPDSKEVQDLSKALREITNQLKETIRRAMERLSDGADGDPILEIYKKILPPTIVALRFDDEARKNFKAELKFRYENKVPPGYQDEGKPDEGAGDLLIWKTILQIGGDTKSDFIFVAGDSKNDWFVRRNKLPFQPRAELLDEYRRASNGATLHIIGLPRLLKLFEAEPEIVTAAENAEIEARAQEGDAEAERGAIEARIKELISEAERLEGASKGIPFDPNESLSLPWNRSANGTRHQLNAIQRQLVLLRKRLQEIPV